MPNKRPLLEQTAVRRNCSKEDVASEAIAAYLEHDAWFRAEVEQGREGAQRGDLVDHREVVPSIEKRFSVK